MTSENRDNGAKKVGPEYFPLQTPGGKIEAVHVRPYGDPKTTIVYGIGWNSTIELQQPMISRMSSLGYDVVSMTPPKALTTLGRRTNHIFPAVEEHKAEGMLAILGYLRRQGTSHVSFVLNSEAAIYGTIAATIAQCDPTLPAIDDLILVAPAGLIADETPPKLVKRFMVDERLKRLQIGDFQLLRKPVSQNEEADRLRVLLSEVQAIASTPIHDLLAHLQEQGIPITIISPKDDGLFPQQELHAAAAQIGADFMSVDGTHRAIYTHTTSVVSRVDLAIAKNAK